MVKLSDAGYSLAEIMALTPFDRFEHGTTEPMGVVGVHKTTGSRGQYVVKFRQNNRMSPKSSCRELLGAWMAAELDIHCIEPVLIDITAEFVKTIAGRQGYKAAVQSLGLNFGSVYRAGLQHIPATAAFFTDDLLAQARRIFMFDMLIGNADRGHAKANVALVNDQLLAYDHELAFSFADLLSFARNPTPWIPNDFDAEMYRHHYFYNLLRGENNQFADICALLTRFDELFWQKAKALVPNDWQSPDIDIIQQHVSEIVLHKEEFAEQLTLILAA